MEDGRWKMDDGSQKFFSNTLNIKSLFERRGIFFGLNFKNVLTKYLVIN